MKLLLRLFVLAITIISTSVEAKEIGVQRAMELAHHYVNQKTTLRRDVSLRLAYTAQSSLRRSEIDYYVFNIGDNQGYILISGDDNTAPVLGWTTEGQFQADSLPSNLKAHLQLFQKEIAEGRKNSFHGAEWPITNATSDQEVVLRTASWGQYSPYNLHTPTVEGTHCLTGCLATAAGIIMRYHKYPEQAMNGVSRYYGQSVTYAPLLWSSMPNMTPIVTNSQEQVAALLWQIGANSNLNYGTSETSGRLDSVLVALRNNFNYSQEARLLLEQAFTTQQWDKMIHAEIDANRPVLYSGQAILNEVQYGHAFVIDGYQGEDFYHVNWGWEGQNNGFFRLHALEATGLNYDRDQAMIIGIKPAAVTDKPITELCYVEWTINPIVIDSYQTELSIFNAGSSAFTGEIALAKVAPNGEIKMLVTNGYSLDRFEQWISITSYSTTFDLIEPLQEGWSIRPVFRETGGKWTLMTQGQDQPWGIVAEGIVNDPVSGTATEPISTEENKVISTPSGILIEVGQSVSYQIYNLQGQCIRTDLVSKGSSQIYLPKGKYVLIIGDRPYKVIAGVGR